jgi:site-specific DNA-methyltransferase (adenine-specific)
VGRRKNTPKKVEKEFGKHPTQKPIGLLRRIVLTITDTKDLVLDPFTGSSTTGLAAFMYGREFIGVDIASEYLDLSIERFKTLLKKNNNLLL